MGRARGLLDGARHFGFSASVRGDMRRLSVVMAVAALDTYMHRLIVERVFTHDHLPAGLARLDMTFEQFLFRRFSEYLTAIDGYEPAVERCPPDGTYIGPPDSFVNGTPIA